MISLIILASFLALFGTFLGISLVVIEWWERRYRSVGRYRDGYAWLDHDWLTGDEPRRKR